MLKQQQQQQQQQQPQKESEKINIAANELTEPLVVEVVASIEDNVSQITEMENKRLKYSFPFVFKLTPFHYENEQVKFIKPRPSKLCNQSEKVKNNNFRIANVSDSKQHRIDSHGYQESLNRVFIMDTARFDYLKSVPYLFSEYRNSRNMKALSCLIRDACSSNCILKTPSVASPLEGQHFIVELFESVSRSIRDNKIEILNVKISDDNKLITTDYIGTGTVVSRDTSDYLWNHLCNRNEYQTYMQKIRAKVLRFGSNAAMIGSRLTGFMISFRAELTMDFVLNDDFTHIQAVIVSRKSLKIKIARELNTIPPTLMTDGMD